jgi:hypothetical protein
VHYSAFPIDPTCTIQTARTAPQLKILWGEANVVPVVPTQDDQNNHVIESWADVEKHDAVLGLIIDGPFRFD